MRVLTIVSITFLFCCFTIADGKGFQPFFVPEELQTILSLVYSRLPPIKLGSDQRLGVGFRIGRNADAQILLELGPQSETQPIGGGRDSDVSKRESRQQIYKTYKKKIDNNLSENTVSPIKITGDKILEKNQTKKEEDKGDTKNVSKSRYVTSNKKYVLSDLKNEPKVTYTTRDNNKKVTDSIMMAQENAVGSNKPTTPEPMINVFMKWLTRFSQSNVSKNST